MFKKSVRGDESMLFEPSGHFVYRVNLREIIKMATGLGAPSVAVKRFNDFYLARFGGQLSRGLSPGWLATRLAILLQDCAFVCRLMNYGLATVLIFKDAVPAAERDLRRIGFRTYPVPRNPYVEQASARQLG